jgi:DHA2 family multidrug resistance protein
MDELRPAPYSINPWLVAPAVMIGTFMEVLDTTIVNVALPHIAGNLSAGVDESTWVLSSYLVSNAMVLPAAGWLAQRFGRKRFLMTCIVIFTLSSLLCGVATSLPMLIVFRIVQGLGGGALQPLSQAILLESFPRRQHGMANAVYGIGVVIAPIIGPTLGGWLTDNYSWRWCFYINLPVGVLALLMIQTFVFDPDYIRHKRGTSIDYVGLGLLVVGLGTLQIVLDKGQREDWFESAWITKTALVSVVALVALVIWELRVEHPIINLRMLRDRNLALGTLMMFGFGGALYGSMVLYPILLQTLMNYTALLSGLVLSPGGIATLFCMPICGRLVGRVDTRGLLIFGFVTSAIGLFAMSRFNLQIGFYDAVWPRVLVNIGIAFTFIPLTTVTFATIPREKIGQSTGIYNLMRNIGGSAGIAAITTIMARRAQFHQTVLATHLTPYNPYVYSVLQQMDATLKTAGPPASVIASPSATGLLYGQMQRQAAMLGVVDSFWLMAVLMSVLVIGLFFFRRGSLALPTDAH